jgi:signal transduction histidine kinase
MRRIKEFLLSTRFMSTLWYSLLFLLLEVFIGITVYYYLYQRLNEQLNASLVKQATSMLAFLEKNNEKFENPPKNALKQAPEDLIWSMIYEEAAINLRNVFIQVVYQDSIIFKSNSLKQEEIHKDMGNGTASVVQLSEFYNSHLSTHKIRVAYGESANFQVYVAFPVFLIAETLRYLKNIFYIIFPIFFLIAFIGGALISSKALSRIDSIINKTDEITVRNLDEKILGEEYSDEYGRLVKKINSMIERIKNSYNYLNQFSISASHELKTPLTILRGEIEVTLMSPKTPAEYKAVLESNYEETLRLINIVDNLFYISRLDRALIQFKMTEMSLNTFVEAVISSVDILGRDKNIEFSFYPDRDVKVQIDDGQMRQALFKLYDNAVKYSRYGSTIETTTKYIPTERKVEISVVSYGDTISPAYLPKLFEPFYRTPEARDSNTPGVGLGLSVVKSILDQHHGEVKAESGEGMNVFKVILNVV